MKKKIVFFLIVFAVVGHVFAIEVLINGVDQATITQGEDFVITINFSDGCSEANINVWADMNGNEIWEDAIDMMIPDMQDEIVDNDLYDEDPAVGVYQITIYGDEDGPNRCSNAGLFYVVEDTGGIDAAYLWIDPITSNYSVSGSVTPAVPNVIILAMSSEENMWMTATDASGNYQSFVPTVDEYMIFAFDPIGVLGGMLSITMYEEILINTHLTGYDFDFIQGNSTIEGTVLDENGAPVVGVIVNAEAGMPGGVWTETNSSGYYNLSVIEGMWEVGFSWYSMIPDYLCVDEVEVYVEDGGTETVDFVVYETDSTIEGTVYLDDIPVAGFGIDTWSEIGMTETDSGINGNYILHVASEADALGGYNVNVDIWNMPDIYVEENYNNIVSGSTGINFHIYTVAGGIEGEVLNANTMQPVEDCWINANDGINWFSTSVEDGYYQLPLPDGTYQIEANGNMYYQQIVEDVVILDEMIQMDFLLEPVTFDGALEGYVYEVGTTIPIENAEVSIGNTTYYTNTATNDEGYYYCDLPNGSYWVDVWHGNYYSYHNDEVIIDYDIVQLDIELEPVIFNGSLEGYVYEYDTTIPIPYANIQVASATYGTYTQADMNGYYYFDLPNELYGADCWMNGFFPQHIDDIEIANNAVIQDFYLEPDVEADNEGIEAVVSLGQNYPNPFNPTTKISFTTISIENTELVIYNIKGQKVKTLINRVLENGDHLIMWEGNDHNNQPVSSGIYFYQLKIGNEIVDSKRMLLLK